MNWAPSKRVRKYFAWHAKITTPCVVVAYLFLCLCARGKGGGGMLFEYYIQSVHDSNITKLDASNPLGIWISLEWIRPQTSRCFEEKRDTAMTQAVASKRQSTTKTQKWGKWVSLPGVDANGDLRQHIRWNKQKDSSIVTERGFFLLFSFTFLAWCGQNMTIGKGFTFAFPMQYVCPVFDICFEDRYQP